jgi:hypothetical protein
MYQNLVNMETRISLEIPALPFVGNRSTSYPAKPIYATHREERIRER